MIQPQFTVHRRKYFKRLLMKLSFDRMKYYFVVKGLKCALKGLLSCMKY